jgi:hypothetical protein
MTISQISNNENGLSVRQKLNSGIGFINYSSSIDETNTAKFSYIDPLRAISGSGNGSLTNPYQTIGEAYGAGRKNFFILHGDAGVLDVSASEDNPNFQIFGMGAGTFFPSSSSQDYPFSQTYDNYPISFLTKTTIKNDNATTAHIHVNSNNGVLINISGVASSTLGAGIECALYNSTIGDVILKGTNGENGQNKSSEDGENGFDGGPAGILYLGYSTVVGNISMVGGNGGSGGDSDESIGGNGGNAGEGGRIVSHYSRILGNVNVSGGIGGQGGIGGISNGSNGSDGSSFKIDSAYSMFSKTPIGTGIAPDFRFSMINGNIV